MTSIRGTFIRVFVTMSGKTGYLILSIWPLCGQGALEETVVRIAQDMKAFQKSHDLERVVVVNLSSAEPEIDETLPQTLEEWESQLKERISKNITASMLYAYAALKNGFPYINFTPSAGSSAPALQEYALLQGVPHYGN